MFRWTDPRFRVAVILVSVVVVTFAFDFSPPESWLRILFALLIIPGGLAGVIVSGHGDAPTAGFIVSILVNSVLWVAAVEGVRYCLTKKN